MARPFGTKYIKDSDEMADLFDKYIEDLKANPFLVQDFVGRDAEMVYREKQRPLTMEGFRCFCFELGYTIKHYFDNTDNRYDDYSTVCTHIKDRIRRNQIEGGMSGMWNPSITQRLNNLVEKTDVSSEGKKIDIQPVVNVFNTGPKLASSEDKIED